MRLLLQDSQAVHLRGGLTGVTDEVQRIRSHVRLMLQVQGSIGGELHAGAPLQHQEIHSIWMPSGRALQLSSDQHSEAWAS